MEPPAQGNELTAARGDLGEQCRALVCLRARGAEKALLEFSRRNACQLLGEIDEVLREVDVADMLERVQLLCDCIVDRGVAVPAVDDGDPREAVEILPARAVIEVLHLAAHDLARFAVEMPETGHNVFLLLFKDGGSADVAVLVWGNCVHAYAF